MKILLTFLFFCFLSGCYVRESIDPIFIIKNKKNRKHLREIKKLLQNKKEEKIVAHKNNQDFLPIDNNFDSLMLDDHIESEPSD